MIHNLHHSFFPHSSKCYFYSCISYFIFLYEFIFFFTFSGTEISFILLAGQASMTLFECFRYSEFYFKHRK